MKSSRVDISALKERVKGLFRGHWRPVILFIGLPMVLVEWGGTLLTNRLNTNQLVIDPADITVNFSATGSPELFGTINDVLSGSLAMSVLLIGLLLFVVMSTLLEFLTTSFHFASYDVVKQEDATILNWPRTLQVFHHQGTWQLAQLLLLKNIFVILWTLLFIIPGVVKGYAYSQAIYLYKEDIAQNGHPTKRVIDYITASRQLMHNRKFERFIVDVSFIGWYIVAALTFGIGLLWLLPYVSGTYAAYHLAIRNIDITV